MPRPRLFIMLSMGKISKRTLFSILTGLALLSCRHDVADLLFDKKIVIPVTPEVVNVTATNPDSTYGTGSTIHIQVVFNTPVAVTGVPYLILNTGTPVTTNINYTSGSGTKTLLFDYTVAGTNSSADLEYSSADALVLSAGATIIGTNGITALLPLPAPTAAHSLSANKNIVIDVNAPLISQVSSITGNGTYAAGAAISIQVIFNTTVAVTGTPQLNIITSGASTTTLNMVSFNGTNTLNFTYTVAVGDSTGTLNYATGSFLNLNGGTITKNPGGTAADLTLPGAPNSLGTQNSITIDGIAPTITSITSTKSDGSYGAGTLISIQVNFSKTVTVTGTPTITINSGAANVNYSSGSPGTTLNFDYTVAGSQNTPDLNVTSVNLAGGTITNQTTNIADLTMPGTTFASTRAIVIDTAAANISNVTSSTSDNTYGIGSVISIQIVFDEPVTVTGTATLGLNSGGNATCSGCSGSTLNLTYTVANGDTSSDLDYSSTGALSGTIKDAAGNNATLTLPAMSPKGTLASTKAIVIDGIRPTVSSMTKPAGGNPVGLLGTPDITIYVNFSKAITITGSLQLTLTNGITTTCSSASGTQLTCFYDVPLLSGSTPVLDYTGTTALTIVSGTIRDAVSNDATLTLPTPGGSSYLLPLGIQIN